jgi:hypothetical protein
LRDSASLADRISFREGQRLRRAVVRDGRPGSTASARVFHFRNEVKMFDITPPLEARLLLAPATFIAAAR